jgi:hypothetical protein
MKRFVKSRIVRIISCVAVEQHGSQVMIAKSLAGQNSGDSGNGVVSCLLGTGGTQACRSVCAAVSRVMAE